MSLLLALIRFHRVPATSCYDPGPTNFSSPLPLPPSSPSMQHIPTPPEPTIRPPTPRPPLPQQPPPQLPMYQTYQTPLSWDTPTWPPPEPLIDISLDQDTDMATARPASPSPEVYTPLDHVQPDPSASVPIIIADPPIPAPTITSDPPALSEAYQLLDRLFPAPPDLPERPYNPTCKPLKPDWNRLLGPSMILPPVIPASRSPSPHPDELLLRH